MNKEIMKKAGFEKEVKLFESGKCPMCKEEINLNDFEDDLILKEYTISGLCQKCQNDIFG